VVLHREFHQHKLESIINIQRFLQSVSGTGIGTDRQKTGTDRPGLFYDVFDKNFQNIIPFWSIINYL
jgi:hypothetical protein